MKKIRFTIGNKILGGFLALIFIFTVNASISIFTLNTSNKIIKENTEVINPSMTAINDFTLMVTRSKMLITNWVYLRSNNDDKEELKNLMTYEYPIVKERLQDLTSLWKNKSQKNTVDSLVTNFENLLEVNRDIMQELNSFEDYDDFGIKVFAEDKIDSEVLPISAGIINGLQELERVKQEEADLSQLSLINNFDQLRSLTFILGIILILFGTIGSFILSRSITNPIKYIKTVISKLGKGELPSSKEKRSFTRDEIGEMAQAVDSLVQGLKSTSFFAESIGKGNYNADYKPLSENDVLGNALLEMRNNLQKVAEEDKKRRWATEGMAKFGEILRKNNDNLSKLSDEIISNLIQYLKANQGGLYILNNEGDEEYLSLAACYAWDKKKYLDQKVYIGEGLTGQAWLEKDVIYLTEVPNEYIKITSGLGEANPTSILIVPLKVNDKVYGVIEMASFKLFDDYHINFVEKIAESIASSISSAKINERTQRLLEESQEMTEQMRAQEEEMRQNMEELQATQEEIERSQKDTQDKEKIMSSTTMIFELDKNFIIQSINSKVEEILKVNKSDLLGSSIENLLDSEEGLILLKDQLLQEKIWSGPLKFKIKKESILTKASAGVAHNPYGEGNKYLLFAADISNVMASL